MEEKEKTIQRYQPTELGTGKVTIKPFQPKSIRSDQPEDYSEVRKKYGNLATTDQQGKSIKASAFQLNPEARKMLGVENEEKRQLSDLIQAEVNTQIELLTEEAQKKGFEAGFQAGRTEAMNQVREESQKHFDQFKTFMDSAESMKGDLWRANERSLIDLVFQISRSILLRDLKEDKDYIVRLVSQVVEKMGIRENIKVRIHPDDFSNLEYIKQKIQMEIPDLKNLQVLQSESVELGGCKIESELTEIDASVNVQLEKMREALDGKIADSN